MSTPAPQRVRFEHHESGSLGIGEPTPRLSWQLADAPGDYAQCAYDIAWEVTEGAGGGTNVGHAVVHGGEQVLVPWPGPVLDPRDRASVRVRVQGPDGVWSPWSAPATAERGLGAADWTARLVGPGYEEGPRETRRAPLVRGSLTIPEDTPISVARLHLTAHGLAEVELNGVRVGRDELVPGWTPYHERLRVFSYDVTDLVRPGSNVLGAWLADGWFRGRYGFDGGMWDIYGAHVGLLAQLEVTTVDGVRYVAGTDESWRSAPGPLTLASLYDGETLDARLLPRGWSEPGFDDAGWTPVAVHPLDTAVLAAPDGPPVRCTGELAPVLITPRPTPGTYLLDLGQNHAGRLRLRVPATTPGTVITIRHAEVLQEGELYTRTLRDAVSVDTLITTGDPIEWEPRFTVHGFRYAEVSGWPGAADELGPGDVVSRVLHSDMERTGWFTASDPDVERLHENAVWSLRSNFVDIPTDCPQRDERLGWTGDLQVFAPTAAFLYDVHGMLADWLRTVASEQQRHGTVGVYAPWIPGGGFWQPTWDIAGWGDVASLTPLALYERSGDAALLARQYASATAWVDRIADLAGPSRLWSEGMQLGDWLDPAAPPDNPMLATTDPHLVATAHLAHSARAVARTADVLGRHDDHERYTRLADEVAAAYAAAYVDSPDPLHSSQSALALGLAFGLVPDGEARVRAGRHLARLVREGGFRVATGFAGTPVITWALSQTGHLAEAYGLLLSHAAPSWLAMVDLGATTIWERWDSMLQDGTVNPGDMTSFNHYALGSVADWLHAVVAGLAPGSPGWRTLRIAPRPGGGLTHAGARHLTPYGEASVAWEIADGVLTVRWHVPVGATAVVDVPGVAPHAVGHGDGEVRAAWDADASHAVVIGDLAQTEGELATAPTP